MVVSGLSAVSHATQRSARAGVVIQNYVALTKPRIIELLLVTTLPAMMCAAHGLPPAGTAAATLVGGTLAAGSANVLNCFIDRDIDALMHRTANRPLNRAVIAPRNALVFGVVLGALAAVFLALTTNSLTAELAVAAIAFYVLIYTALLKRRTSANIVWGGAAGCMPVLIGWSAVTGSLAWTPAALFAVIFLWTPPHFWALAMHYRADYAAADIPMLPVVAPPEVVTTRIITYSWAMVVASLLIWPIARTSPFYAVASVVLGAEFIWEAYALKSRVRAGVGDNPMRLFHMSITYLTVLFIALGVDTILPHSWH
jgi:protoheme IX farnesyltransferase